ncbi:Speckle-type POZ protein B [Araneus ventricosus]|uniref:Speckle-type POZ protein B n=1 Tax=Araneus ventricosus TaxID=182803 RepID=A0A4Y2ESN5_ARAVE|nr:Speckle-type POZ protein B [Araneus ventricosus]
MACKFDTNRKGFTFIWILENFEYCEQKTGQFLKSPTFIVDTIERTKWSLWICPRGYKSESWISLFLGREEDSKGPATIEVDYEVAFLASDGAVLKSLSIHKHAFPKPQTYGFIEFQKRESVFAKQSTFLPQGTLTIRCRIWKGSGEVKFDGQCVARTRIGVERKAFMSKIQHFSSFDVGQEITFRLKSTSDDKPIMSFILFLHEYWRDRKTTICIKFVHLNQSIVFSRFKSSLVDAKGDYVDCGQHEFSPPITDQEAEKKWLSRAFQCKEFMLSLSKDTLMGNKCLYLPNDILTLCCEYAFSSGVVFEGIETTTYGCSNPFTTSNVNPEIIKTAGVEKSDSDTPSDLKMDISSMLQDNFLCDVKLCTESETFPAHWFILSARSPVFRAMFKIDMKKKAKDRIDIVDLKSDTVRRMLLYMYTDSLGEIKWKTAFDLYIAAKKFEIMTLKDKCSSFLKTNLSLTNACKILLLADLHQDEELKSAAQDFILKSDNSIINSSEWKLLMKRNLQLAAETMLLRYK